MNKYEIIGIVGEGAYGVVYKAKCKESGEFGKYITWIMLCMSLCQMVSDLFSKSTMLIVIYLSSRH